jgi:hypothetical protein
MEEKHPKCVLFEFFAKKGLVAKPIITHTSSTKPKKDHEPDFTCEGSIEFDGKLISAESSVHKNKKDAEKEMFQILLEHLLKIDQLDKSTSPYTNFDHLNKTVNQMNNRFTLSHKVIVVIDYENCSKKSEIDRLFKYFSSCESENKIVRIAGYMSSVKDTADIVVRSSRNDAVDHFISFYIGQIYGSSVDLSDTKIFIMSRDKFSGCLEDFCPIVKHVVDIDDLINYVSQNMIR